jgi:NitT/TauT family transport system substrate-binding protein
LYLAQYLGAYGKDVDVIQLSSATEVMRAMAHGSVDVAALTLDEALLLASKGMDLVAIRVMDISRGGDAIVTLNAGAQNSLSGLKVGVENTALGAIVLSEALVQAGLNEADLEVVNLSVDEHEKALVAGRVDAVVTFEPVKSRLISKGAQVMFDTTQAPDLVVDMLVVREEALAEKHAQLVHLVQGYLTARQYMTTHRREAEAFFGKRLNLYPDQLQLAFAGLYLPTPEFNRDWFSGSPSMFENTCSRIQAIMQARNLVEGEPKIKTPPGWLLEVSI